MSNDTKRRYRERMELLDEVLLEVWRKTTAMLGRPIDELDTLELRAILLTADPDFKLREALDGLVLGEGPR